MLKMRSLQNLMFLVSLILIISGSQRLSAQTPPTVFPINVSTNGRYLKDQKGNPFFYLADTGWQIFNKLTKAEAEQYLEDRKKKGFNVIQAQIVGHFPDAASNTDGQQAFSDVASLTPNDKYFDHVEWVLQKASEKSLLVALSTMWFGYNESGWYHHMNNENIKPYAQYLANRFKKYNNIIWIHGGDWKPKKKTEAINIMANILKKDAPHQLQTFHNGFNGASTDDFGCENWLDINMSVAVDPIETYSFILSSYNHEHPKALPVVMGEPPYELERTDDYGIRSRAYWTMFSGGAGFAYGVIPVWNFDKGWQNAMQADGGKQLAHLKSLMTSRKWYDLVPDQNSKFVVAGRGAFGSAEYVTATKTEDGTLVLAYLPKSATVTVNLSKMTGKIKAQWFDPTNGSYKTIDGSPFQNTAVKSFIPSAFNSIGGSDWVLVLEVE